ncbi:ABC transporter substrate-binding protein [Vibrio coralliilyticus]|uniref:ABC transporter substrate-binding protein n=1 Tax=Vibrio coralliilyticus TaxID=190893 RepID=UPI000BAAEE3C|nr:iron-siderophore ABC transporter substrate-binding protein [Vibrio coralliilyticus]NOI57886.1 iron-siderophore ABC transporter substrate-binding protein [Vibrio coralliilyticus]PAT69824.1 peptide ABC transporter substrate-binding protein [Vibrio coralliilyticus]
MKRIIILLTSFLAFAANAFEIKHELGVASFEQAPKKVVALDWALTETVLSLGVMPQGIADVAGYNTWVAQPELDKNVIDVGSRREPNLELIADLKPDVILISEHIAPAYKQLEQIAPVLVYTVYSDAKTPLASAENITRSLGKLFNKEQQAQTVIEQTTARLKTNGDKIKAANADLKPLMFIRFINDKTLRIHSDGSLAQSTITKMGLKNDWHETTNMWGFTTAGTEKLAEHQKTNLMIFGPLKDKERKQLTQSPLWQAMEFTRTDSVYELPAIWTFGGLIAAQRFSDHITEQLTSDKQ